MDAQQAQDILKQLSDMKDEMKVLKDKDRVGI
jgi:hypothetical protein